MATPTAIPHAEASAHHHAPPATPPPTSAPASSAFSRSPTGTSPNPVVSPIYTSAGRSAFSLPGPNSASTSPTTTSWYSAGFASNNSQRVRSPPSNFVTSKVSPQRDHWAECPSSAPVQTSGFGTASRSSSISSADLMSEPTTPKPLEGGLSLGRVSSIPMGSSFDQIKGHRGSWGPHSGSGWNGLNNFRGSAPTADNGGAMSGILRKFSFGNGSQPPLKPGHARAASCATPVLSPPPQQAPPVVVVDRGSNVDAGEMPLRGRQASAGSIPKRRPSPMGERLLMGHFNAH